MRLSGQVGLVFLGMGLLAACSRPAMQPVGYTAHSDWDSTEARGEGYRPPPPAEERRSGEPLPLLGAVRPAPPPVEPSMEGDDPASQGGGATGYEGVENEATWDADDELTDEQFEGLD
jgi:hypothetical protein